VNNNNNNNNKNNNKRKKSLFMKLAIAYTHGMLTVQGHHHPSLTVCALFEEKNIKPWS
jgi:hypothetical protein